jgi:copper transport protein
VDGFPSATTIAIRLAVFASHALVFGLVPIFLLVLRPALSGAGISPERRAAVGSRAEVMVLVALIVGAAGSAYALVQGAAEAADLLGTPLDADAFRVVLETQFGLWHLLRFPLALALLALLVGKVKSWGADEDAPRRWWLLWGLLAAMLLASTSLAGHAAASDIPAIGVPNDVLHLAAGATWLTGVVALTWLLPIAGRGSEDVDRLRVLAPAVDRFSRVAFWSIMVVAATGTVNALLHLGSFEALVSTDYGRTLMTKLSAFACIVGLGAVNHYVMRGRLLAGLRAGRPVREQTLLRRAVAVEVALAVFVLGATGVLVSLPPPP